MESFRIKIDSHQHFWNYDPVRYSWIDDSMVVIKRDFLPDDLQPLLIEHQIDACIAVQAQQNEEETHYLLNLAANHNFIKGIVGWVDLNSPDIEKRLKHFASNSIFKGVRHTVYDQEGEFMLEPSFLNGISMLKEFGLTYDILVFDYQLPGAVKLAEKFPDQPFVLDHLGKPQISRGVSPEWKQNMKRLGRFKNVYCKLSGLVTETDKFQWQTDDFHPFLKVAFNAFGEDRLLYGSDWPMCLSAASYSDTVSIVGNFFQNKNISGKVFGTNAFKFYNLKI